MTVNTPHRRGTDTAGAFDRVANISIKETPGDNAVASNIRVVVRVRPENKAELNGNFSNVVRVLDERLLIFDPKEEEAPDFYRGRQRTMRDFSKKKKRDMRFAFDYVFDMDCRNLDVYENTTKSVLDGLLDGFNCSVFAYGATGAGKTFTMKGTLEQPGVMFLTMMDLYQRIDQMKEEKICGLAVSYLEVYNEQIRDLLNPGQYLPIREDPNSGSVVSGLSLHKPKDAEELLHMLEFGNRNRTQHPTDANAESSRSHGVFQVFVRQKERTANVSADVSVAKMSLIDLAGSERATVTKNCGVRFREGANINKSLLALGNCINALAEGKSKGYVPYRNSKLTRLLKDSLGGNCRTVMIAAVSPSALSYEDTYNTLKYADRAKNIKANLKKNVVSVDYHISHYAKLVEELRGEVEQYKDKLRSYEQDSILLARPPSSLDTEVDRLQEVMFSVFQDRMNIRKEIMEMEGSDRDLTFRIYQKEKCLSRIALLHSDTANTQKVTSKIQRAIHTSKKRQANMVKLKSETQEKMSRNMTDLQRVENQMNTVSTDGSTPEILELSLRTRHLEVELRDTKRQVKFLKKLCRAQQRQTQATEKLVTCILKGFKKQYYILRSYGCATPDLEADFESVQQMLLGDREVSWADQSVIGGEIPGGEVFDTRKDSTDECLDINHLLDFPVLVSVDTTPKTPHQSSRGRAKMPGSAQSVAMTPCTPGSHKRGRFTPRRRSSMPVFDMVTPVTATMSGSHQLLTPTAKPGPVYSDKQSEQVYTSSSNLTGSPLAIDDDFEILSSGPSSALKTKSRLNLPPLAPPVSQAESSTLTLSLAPKPVGQVIYRPPPVLTNSKGGIQAVNTGPACVNCGKDRSMNNGVHVKCEHSMAPHLNETFTKIEWIEPFVDSPCVSKQSKSVHVGSNLSSQSSDKGEQTVCKSYCVNSGPFLKPTSHNTLNETFTQPALQTSQVQSSNSSSSTHTGSWTYSISSEPFIKPTNHQNTVNDTFTQPTMQANSHSNNAHHMTQTVAISQPAVQPGGPPGIATNPMPSVTTLGGSGQSLLATQGSKTVTKSRPETDQTVTISDQRVHPESRKTMLNVTVTKQQATVLQGKENVSPAELDIGQSRPGVVRAMDFSNMPSPAGKLTFAQALKSPAVRSLQQAGVAPFSPRSPLSARENLPQRSLFSQEIEQVSKKPVPVYKDDITKDLERMGLPSVRERAHSASRVPVTKPGYMKMTAAVSHRNKIHSGNEENHAPVAQGRPSRVAREQTKKPARLLMRSKSFNVTSSAPKWKSRF